MRQIGGRFFIRAQDHDAALAKLKAEHIKDGFSWTDSGFSSMATLVKALEDLGWTPKLSGEGHINDLCFEGEKAGDEDRIFKTIAPYVSADSYLEMRGEDGDLWRWVFDGKTCRSIRPTIVWAVE
jgi:hypothetical protein